MKGDKLVLKARKLLKEPNPDLPTVVTLLEEARQLGNAEAIYALGTWHFHGKYFKKKRKKGFKMFLQAAELNYSYACYDAAVSFELGVGTHQDEKKAFEYYYKAMLLGHKQSIYEVGRCYYYGIGTKKNKSLASLILDIAENVYNLS